MSSAPADVLETPNTNARHHSMDPASSRVPHGHLRLVGQRDRAGEEFVPTTNPPNMGNVLLAHRR